MRQRQQGMTLIGLLFVLAMAGVIVYAGIRLAPLYLNYMKVVRSLDATADRSQRRQSRSGGICAVRWSSTGRSRPSTVAEAKDVEITKDDGGVVMHVAYDDSAPYIANVSLIGALRKDREGAVSRGASRTSFSHWVERSFGHVFASAGALCRAALTHRSAGGEHNERLEFLGDSILNCSRGAPAIRCASARRRGRPVAVARHSGERRDAGADRRRISGWASICAWARAS